jgi:alcohol dehydrogenase (cytochrome c)
MLLCATLISAQQHVSRFVPVTDQMLVRPRAEDWLSWRRTLDGWGYSPLDLINTSNVTQLTLVWSRALGAGLQETTPLAYDGVVYLPSPNDVIQAIDARTGDVKWEYRRRLPDDLWDYLPAPDVKRNIAIYANLIIASSGDNFVYALHAESGTLVWETRVLDYRKGAQQSSGPIIADGKVITGRGCEPEGGPDACVVTAHDARTGVELWRTRTIALPGEPGGATWGDVPLELRRHVGTWMPPSYDPGLGLLFIGTSVTSPAPKFMLAGNDKTYLYHNSTLAIDAKTGRIVWYYQHLVDHWDIDHTFERMLVDSPIETDRQSVPWANLRVPPGERRPLITGIPGKSGIVYTLDRRTGEFLWARPTVEQNLVKSIDGATGRVTGDPAVRFDNIGDERLVCPSSHGGKDWQAGAYSPLTNVMYFPLQNTCMMTTAITPQTRPDSLYAIRRSFQLAPNAANLGSIHAISVKTGATMWRYDTRAATSSLVATGGDLLLGGDASGRFRALDPRTGRVLWEVNLGSPIAGFPITYAVDGRQYVAVTTGRSGHTGIFARLAGQPLSITGNNIFVFALPAVPR